MQIYFETMVDTEACYRRASALRCIAWPDHPLAAHELRHEDVMLRAERELCSVLVHDGRRDLAWVSVNHNGRPDHWHAFILLSPDVATAQLGSACCEHLRQMLADVEVRSLTVELHDRQMPAMQCLPARGFELVHRDPIGLLDLRAYDPDQHAEQEQSSLQLQTLESLSGLPDWRERLYAMRLKIDPDLVPDEPFVPQSFDMFVSRRLDSPLFNGGDWLIAIDGEQWVGLTGIASSAADKSLAQVCFTGVQRQWRKCGLARALKLRMLRVLKERGLRAVVTENNSDNPLLTLNTRLGFVPRGVWLMWRDGDVMAPDATD